MDLRIVAAQTNPRLGDVQKNLAEHLERIEEAVRDGAHAIVFPELSLTGYFLKDQVFDLGLARDAKELEPLREASRSISIGFGFVERTHEGRFFNSWAWAEDGEIQGVHRKVHLVSYGMFDEARDFAAGEEFRPFASKLGRFGPLVCEDLWHMPSSYLHFLNDVDVLFVPSASPARGVEQTGEGLASKRTWSTLLTATALFTRTWVVYIGRVGWEDGIGFGGSTCVIDPTGNTVATLGELEPGCLEARLDSETLLRARVQTPLRRDEKPWILATGLAEHVPLLARMRDEVRREPQ